MSLNEDPHAMLCWKCQKKIGESPMKIGFRAVCMHCDVDLHVCKNCRYFSPGKPNDCLVPGTDSIRDREASNLCEEFKPKTNLQTQEEQKRIPRIFGEGEIEKKKGFDDLFH